MSTKHAIGVIETCGMPAAIVTADALEKAANVRVVGLENTDAGRISVIIQGYTGAVQVAIATTIEALQNHPGALVLGHHIIPCPDDSADLGGLLGQRFRQNPTHNSVEWLDD